MDDDLTMPIITLEVLSEDALVLLNEDGTFQKADTIIPEQAANVVIDSQNSNDEVQTIENGNSDGETRIRTDQLEYVTRKDGSVICKLCGEILQSRTHWYRHKYKVHVVTSLNPTPLFQCEQCLLYFKSRKGYIGHLASSHSEMLADASPVLCNSQIQEKSCQSEKTPQIEPYVIIREIKERTDLTITKTNGHHGPPGLNSIQNNNPSVGNNAPIVTIKTVDKTHNETYHNKKYCRIAPKPISALTETDSTRQIPEKLADLQAARSREEKLVTDIIERVRRECELQGVSGPAPRRGYARRSVTMT